MRPCTGAVILRTRPHQGKGSIVRVLKADKQLTVLHLLLEGNSIRSVERITGVHRDTIIDAMVTTGEKCQEFLEATIQGVPVDDVEVCVKRHQR